MTSRLFDLVQGIRYQSPSQTSTIEAIKITQITEDSRRVTPGTLFVALRGVHADGHLFVPKAIEAGASAVVVEELPKEQVEGVVYLVVEDTAKALGELSARWEGNPSEGLTIVGVTGTNGKTTIATLLYRLFRSAGYSCGLISTVCNYIEDEPKAATHTTPSAPELQRLLRQMKDAGCTHVFMEVSSHAMAQHRTAGVHFSGGIFTNLTRDHLDYHGTVEAYLKAKKSFFDGLDKDAFALTNLDEKSGPVMLQNTRAKKYSYALRNPADYKARILERYPYGTSIELCGKEVLVQLIGDFNVYNILAVYASALLLGMEQDEALRHISTLKAVDGRFQTLISPHRGYIAIVDYAHTPDALVNVLDTIREIKGKDAKVICVVGCGGDRDKGKRPIMAHEAALRSEKLILTSDNSRTEKPETIIQEMVDGLSSSEQSRTLKITDRAEAIRTATMLADRGDIILVAGKGHETYQEINGERHHFDDREVIKAQFAQEV